MRPASKIAPCCYCGTRAALVLSGAGRHELACHSCGAPLHNLKHIPVTPGKSTDTLGPRSTATPQSIVQKQEAPKAKPKKNKAISCKPRHKMHKRSRKSAAKRAKNWVEDVFDVLEDIFD